MSKLEVQYYTLVILKSRLTRNYICWE